MQTKNWLQGFPIFLRKAHILSGIKNIPDAARHYLENNRRDVV